MEQIFLMSKVLKIN